jgi:hypothetical protein
MAFCCPALLSDPILRSPSALVANQRWPICSEKPAGLLRKTQLDHINAEVILLTEKKDILLKEISALEIRKNLLAGDIKIKEEKVSKLKELKNEYDTLLHDLTEMEARVNRDKKRWQVYEGFLGLMQSSSIAELQKSVIILPKLLEEAQEGEYSPELLKNFILKELVGSAFQVMKCRSCDARFYIDKPPPVGGYQCPVGGFGHSVAVDKDALAILQAALANAKPRTIILSQTITRVSKSPEPKDKDKA